MKKLIPADTVDAAGNVWETTGENIRNGVREISERDVKMFVNVMFPVGSIYCGENSFIIKVGKWVQLTEHDGTLIAVGNRVVTGMTYNGKTVGDITDTVVSMRLWKRVS